MKQQFDDLQKACEPVIEYLRLNHDPHTVVIVSQESIKLQKIEIGIPVKYED